MRKKVFLMTYRNKKLLALANESPHCMSCGTYNAGNVVAAHSNQQRDGKGVGIKAKDYRVAYLCDKCHTELDAGSGAREHKVRLFEDAHRKTIGWLFESGHLEVR